MKDTKKLHYKIGMTCRKHGRCDIVNVHEGVSLCTAKHHYELYDKNHRYDLVFYTHDRELYLRKEKV
jgi:hypothetical protein